MASITFVQPDGSRSSVEVAPGTTIMQAATAHGVQGIVAECGGNAMCATCHVYVDPLFLDRLQAATEDEDALLDGAAAPRQPGSRLGCQVAVTNALDGLVVTMPDCQV